MTIRIDGTNTAANPGITGSDTDTGLQFGTDEVNIVTGGSTRATVDSSGRVGVGITNPSQARLVAQTSSGSSIAAVKDNTGASVVLGGVTQPRILLEASAAASNFVIYTAGGSSYGSASWSEKLRVLADGGITFNGDTAAANALDDYEEGTWVPSIDIGSSTTGITYSDTQGLYTKIGNIVIAQCFITLSSKGTATGYVRIDGLPFGAITPNSRPTNAGVLVTEGGTSSWPQSTTYGLTWSDGYVYLRYNGVNGWVGINDTHLTNSSAFYWSSTFRVS